MLNNSTQFSCKSISFPKMLHLYTWKKKINQTTFKNVACEEKVALEMLVTATRMFSNVRRVNGWLKPWPSPLAQYF